MESSLIFENIPKAQIETISFSNKKLLLLDLDETLIHSDFSEEFLNNKKIKYDAIISFYSDNLNEKDENDSNITDDESKDYSNEKVLNTVGIFIHPGVYKFLAEITKYFEVGIFTGAIPEYADAVINYLDPDNKYIKLRIYRNHCINIGDLL